MNWIFLFYVLSLFTYCKMFKRTRNSLDNWLQNSYLTFRNKDFIFILKVAILSFKSLRFILLFRVRSLFEAMFFPILNLHVSVVINFDILLLKFWLKFSASQSAPCSLSLYILCKSRLKVKLSKTTLRVNIVRLFIAFLSYLIAHYGQTG